MNESSDSTIDLEAVEAEVAAAIRGGGINSLRLLGHGEISIVLAWPQSEPTVALKRVPPFRNAAEAKRYVDVCHGFFDTLRAADVAIWPTELLTLVRSDGRAVVYHRQPIADIALLASNVLRDASPADSHPLLDAIVDAAARVCGPTLGFDVQLANWLWDGSTATQLDFTSPFTLTASRKDITYDAHAFLQEYPLALRPYLRRELTKLIQRYTTPEGALADMVANMLKEGLDGWVDPAVATINGRLGTNLQRATAQRMLDEDRKFLPMVLKLKKGQRWWLHHTGRRYEALLPDETTYDRAPSKP
ncbi:MAG TPA: DUF6206 family protein [Ilumatobacteraceae bacterium]|nr:DUF6206 family protein [Ilumatobacteraceae bacterium]HRB03628.1 DUF6206 family protein [Ilumatobacteraceae bacterium]